jgi:hypothetical protein
MAKKTAEVERSCCKSAVRLSDTHGGLKRIRTLLAALGQRICDTGADTIAFAFHDAAAKEVEHLLNESVA